MSRRAPIYVESRIRSPMEQLHRHRASVASIIVGGIAAAVVVLSMLLDWISRESSGRSFSVRGADLPAEFLWAVVPDDRGPTLLIVTAPIAALILIGAIVRRARVVAIIGGSLAILVALLFVLQMAKFSLVFRVFDATGIGPLVAFLGGVTAIIVGLMPRSN